MSQFPFFRNIPICVFSKTRNAHVFVLEEKQHW